MGRWGWVALEPSLSCACTDHPRRVGDVTVTPSWVDERSRQGCAQLSADPNLFFAATALAAEDEVSTLPLDLLLVRVRAFGAIGSFAERERSLLTARLRADARVLRARLEEEALSSILVPDPDSWWPHLGRAARLAALSGAEHVPATPHQRARTVTGLPALLASLSGPPWALVEHEPARSLPLEVLAVLFEEVLPGVFRVPLALARSGVLPTTWPVVLRPGDAPVVLETTAVLRRDGLSLAAALDAARALERP